jgi:hypothetical protein
VETSPPLPLFLYSGAHPVHPALPVLGRRFSRRSMAGDALPPMSSAAARHGHRPPCSGGPLALQVVPMGAHRLGESDGADHAAGDLPAGEIRPVSAAPASAWLTCGVIDPLGPACLSLWCGLWVDNRVHLAVLSADFKRDLRNAFSDFC